jgi:hypothetical protein
MLGWVLGLEERVCVTLESSLDAGAPIHTRGGYFGGKHGLFATWIEKMRVGVDPA